MKEWFRRAARLTSDACGTWQAFIANVALVLVWIASGPFLDFSTDWQLVANTVTTIVSYILIFLVMNTQARDTAEIRLKLDELILSNAEARNRLLRIDEVSEDEIKSIRQDMIREAEGDNV